MIPSLSLPLNPKHSAVICSLATDHYVEMMDVMAPTVEYYANLHGFDHILIRNQRLCPSRPASWDRVPLIRHLMKTYSLVMWLDADVMIVDPSVDIRTALDPKYSVYVVNEYIPENGNQVPNTGVWLLRNEPDAIRLLEAVWAREDCIEDGWHEQKAFLFLIGWVTGKFTGPTEYSGTVSFIDKQWNSTPGDPAPKPKCKHYIVHNKLDQMKKDFETFRKRFLHHHWWWPFAFH